MKLREDALTSFSLRLVSQWVAGETSEAAIDRVKKSNLRGLSALVNLLGEDLEKRDLVQSTLKEYSRLLALVNQSKLDSQISVKLTQLGLKIDFDYCLRNLMLLAEECESYSNWLWIDMEGSEFTQKTIDLYTDILEKYGKTGIAIQANLRRSESDLKFLLPLRANIRLVKGAYNEPFEIAYKKKDEVRTNFSRLLNLLFDSSEQNFFAVATHDGALVEKAKELAISSSAKFEFEMLMGIRDKLKLDLVSEKYKVREYIPYGPEWFSYSMRRLREKKSNILLMARSLFSRS